MGIGGWKYYNHIATPVTPPHKNPDISAISDGKIWRAQEGGVPLLARWTTAFDCGHESNWWYVIKDTPFDISTLKAKRRYEIKRGLKNFDVKIINPSDYKEELYRIQTAAYSAYPKKYRPKIKKGRFIEQVANWSDFTVFGAFFKASGLMEGYAYLVETANDFIEFRVLKTNPDFEKYSINAALVEKILSYYEKYLAHHGIICDGSRSVYHETHFQDYLEKYFGFRKAYCDLHIVYNPRIKPLITLVYPFRKFLLKLDENRIVHQLNAVLKMEELARG